MRRHYTSLVRLQTMAYGLKPFFKKIVQKLYGIKNVFHGSVSIQQPQQSK